MKMKVKDVSWLKRLCGCSESFRISELSTLILPEQLYWREPIVIYHNLSFKASPYYHSTMQTRQFMFNDIQKSIDLGNDTTVGAPNILIALGLSCCTEYWGKLLLGLPREESKKCYESFLKRLGFTYGKNPYAQLLNKGLNIYQDVRCGLVHAYGIERDCKVSLDEADCGICYDQIKDHYDFHIKTYFKDFKDAVNMYIQNLENDAQIICQQFFLI